MPMLGARAPTMWRMSERLYKLLLMWRLCGCFFVANLNRAHLIRSRVTWKSFYIVYSLLCASILFSFTMSEVYTRYSSVSGSRFTYYNSLYTVMKAVVGMDSVVVFLVMAFRSGAILRFLRNAQSFERSLVLPGLYLPKRTCLETHVLKASFLVSFMAYTIALFVFLLRVAYRYLSFKEIMFCVYRIVSHNLFLLCDFGNEATIRATGEVLVNYVLIQLSTLEQKRESGLTIKDVQDLRLSMLTIQRLKEEINAVFGPCIVLFCLRAFSVVSISGYMLVRLGLGHDIRMYILLYSLYVASSLMDLAMVSQTLEKETEKVKVALADVATTGLSPECISQINSLHDSIEPRDMCLSGSGFFVVSSKILLAVAEVAVTYSVILIQTGDALLRGWRPTKASFTLQGNVTQLGENSVLNEVDG